MTEQPKNGQSKGIGELFVEFGSTGLGDFLKGLNGVKAQFLLSKAAAEQFTKPLINMSKNAAGGITSLTKLNAVTGMSVKQLQELQIWTKLNNVGFGEMMGQIEGLQHNLLEIAMGRGNIRGFALLGLDPRQMDYRKPLEAFSIIRERVQQLDEATGALALKELGFSQDLLYAFKQQNNAFDQRLLLNEKETQALTEQQTAWNSLSATWQAAQDKFIAKQEWINQLLSATQKGIEFVSRATKEDWYNAINKAIPRVGNAIKEDISNPKESKIIRAAFPAIDMGVEGAKILADYLQYTFGNEGKGNNISQPISQPFNNLEVIPDSELGADNAINENLPALPQMASTASNTTNIQVAVTQNISGDDSIEIASRTRDSIEDMLNTLTIQNGAVV